MARMIMIFFVLVMMSTFRDINLHNAQNGLEKAIGFYAFGFKKIKDALSERQSPRASDADPYDDFIPSLGRIIYELVFTLFFWGITLYVLNPFFGLSFLSKKSEATEKYVPVETVVKELDCNNGFTNSQKDLILEKNYENARSKFKGYVSLVEDAEIIYLKSLSDSTGEIELKEKRAISTPRNELVFTFIKKGEQYNFDCRISNYCGDYSFFSKASQNFLTFSDCIIENTIN